MKLSYWHRRLIGIFVAALVVRVLFVLTMQDGFMFFDSTLYSSAAENLVAKGELGESYMKPPIYPVFLAGIYTVFGQKIVAIRVVQAFVGAILAVLIGVLGRRMGGETIGALAGFLWSIYPMGVFIAGLVYPTTLATILLLCAVLCILTKAGQELVPRGVVLGGILVGLTALTKPVALVTVALITLWIAYWNRTNRALLVILFVLGVSLPLVPWTMRNLYVHGGIMLVEPEALQKVSSIGNDPKGESEVDTIENPGKPLIRFAREFSHFWELYPQRVKMSRAAYREELHGKDSRVVRKTTFGTSWTSLVSILSVGPMFFFALIGVGSMWVVKEQRRNLSLLCMIVLSFAVGYAFFYGKTRYRIPVEPYILILSAYGLTQMWAILARPAHKVAIHSPEESEAAKASPIS